VAAPVVRAGRPSTETTRPWRSLTAQRVIRARTLRSQVQLRVRPAATGTTVAFDEENLPDEHARAVCKGHWAQVLDDLESAVPANMLARKS